jgi:SAM-dependent methyltransferase
LPDELRLLALNVSTHDVTTKLLPEGAQLIMSDIFHYTELNRQAWNEIATVRYNGQPPASFFAQGHSTLDARELAAAGDMRGKSLLHLQCATGEDTLSWAIAGAQATGVDISEQQIVLARQKAAEADLAVQFVAADIYALPTELQMGSFDIVYTGKGVLVWLPDLTRWAQAIEAALKPGGRFLLFEEHPLAGCLWLEHGVLQLESNYFGRSQPEYSSGWRHFAGGEDAQARKVEFLWPLGDIVTAIAQAGLRIERLEEFPIQPGWRFKTTVGELNKLPGRMLLVAAKDRR